MLRVDLERREIAASVRALVERSSPLPHPGGWLAEARTELGTEVHRQYRRESERDVAGFQGEVTVRMTRRVDGFTAHLRGRLDGLVPLGAGRLLVEEVKSSTEPRAEHSLQLRLYALLVACEHPKSEVLARLVFVSPFDGARRDIDVAFDPDRTAAQLDVLLRRLVSEAHAGAERARRRAALAGRLAFPYPQPRSGQARLMEEIASGLADGRPVLAMAPTGIGKTMGALLPALRHALRRDSVLYFLTAKRTQQAMAARTFLDLAQGPGAAMRALTLRARERMCPPGTLLCHRDHCRHLERLSDRERSERVRGALLSGGPHVDPDAVFRAGVEHTLCPHALSIDLCRDVDLVIGDYNYVYGGTPASGDGPTARGTAVVIDEAHNLFDRARAHYSPFLELERIRGVQPAEHAHLRELAEHLDDLERFVQLSLAESAEQCPGSRDGSRPLAVHLQEWRDLARTGIRIAVRWAQVKQRFGVSHGNDPLYDLLGEVVRMRNLLAEQEADLVPYAADRPQPGLGVLCVDPSRKLAERHRLLDGVVAMSATLTPLSFQGEALGLSGMNPLHVACDSPFPARHRCVVIDPSVSTTYRDRCGHYAGIADSITRLVAIRPGHYIAYFPSFHFLEAVRSLLPEDAAGVLVQERRTSDRQRREILDRLRSDPQPLLLLAVMGGVFAEGIDLPGEALVGVIVVGPGLPQLGFERTAMRIHFDAKNGRGFDCAMLYPGMQRVIQSAGRVHRRPEDLGVIVLLGRRFARRPYRDCLPRHWFVEDPDELLSEDPARELEAFWCSASSSLYTSPRDDAP